MIYPSIEEITKNQYNRYTLCIATAKCARMVTDEYVKQRETAERMLANKETDKSLASMIKREIRDEKAVKNAINRLCEGKFKVVLPGEQQSDDEQAAPADSASGEASENTEDEQAEQTDGTDAE